eukprot:TRINITY_DN3365_c0_g1_i7.p1 TRINITY_DN3365_c0_g1~~TRINITY_DN3365_c0_g1_i7.p1  ORF type:complete len:504 (+),score=72.78 TRINITY_DN3365_c0_g1_i7:91-1512(+)
MEKPPLVDGRQSKQPEISKKLLFSVDDSSKMSTPIMPPMVTPRSNMSQAFKGLSSDADTGFGRRRPQPEEELQRQFSPPVEPFRLIDQNAGRVDNNNILGQPLDYYQQQKSIDSYYPSVRLVQGPGGDGLGVDTSTQQVVNQVLLKLKLNQEVLEIWSDRLRQWLSRTVFGPLVELIGSTHREVNEKAAKLGLTVNLPSLDSGVTASRQNPAHDDGQTVLILRQQLQHTLNQLLQQRQGALYTPQNQSQKEQQVKQLEECLRATIRYQNLRTLLLGQFIKSDMLLGSSGYLVSRIKQLAIGSCLGEYVWNGGGNFYGQTWNSSLPTDTALVFYILAAFLKAPNWIWPEDESMHIPSSSGPLYLGEIPVRTPERFAAIVTSRPVQGLSKGATVMYAMLQPQYPQFSLILEGQEVCTVGGYAGLFHCFLMMLQYVKQQLGGKLGGNSLELYRLSEVIMPVEKNYAIMQKAWFGLW